MSNTILNQVSHQTESLQSILEENRKKSPDAIALETLYEKVSYNDLDLKSNQIAQYLLECGVNENTVVGIEMSTSLEIILSLLAILKVGACFVIIDSCYTEEQLKYVQRESGISVVITSSVDAQIRWDSSILKILYNNIQEEIGSISVEQPNCIIKKEKCIWIYYDLLKNGLRKVKFDFNSLLEASESLIEAFEMTAEDVVILPINQSVSNILKYLLAIVRSRAKLVLYSKEEIGIAEINQIIHDFRPTILEIPEKRWYALTKEILLNKETLVNGSLRLVSICNGKLLTRYAMLWREWLLDTTRLVHCYCPDNFPLVCLMYDITKEKLEGMTLEKIPIGTPLRNNRLYLIDKFGNPAPMGIPCRLYIESSYLAPINGEKQEAIDNFCENKFAYKNQISPYLYETQESVCYHGSKYIEWLGNKDEILICKGHKINLKDLELSLIINTNIYDVELASINDGTDFKELVVAISGNIEEEVLVDKLRKWLIKELPIYIENIRFVSLEKCPRLLDGKLDMGALKELGDRIDIYYTEDCEEFTNLEEELHIIWSHVLGVKKLSIHDNFFEIGGTSLVALQLLGEVNEKIGLQLNLGILANSPTIAMMATTIKNIGVDNETYDLVKILPDVEHLYTPFPLTDVQEAYWAGRSDEFELGNVATHSYFEYESDLIDIKRINAAWNLLIQRHGMLRAIILSDGTQVISKEVPQYEIKVYELGRSSESVVQEKIEEIRQRLSHQILKTDQWPLFEICAIQYNKNTIRLFASIDALIMDTWSFQVILYELDLLYRDIDMKLEKLEIDFRDYVVAQQKLYQSDVYEEARSYWMNRLTTLPPAPQLPTAKNPATLEKPKFVRYGGKIEKDEWKRIKDLAGNIGITASALLLTTFSDVLGIWSKNKHFTINLTLFNHLFNHDQVKEIVGDFTSITLLEVNKKMSDSLKERSKEIQDQLWNDLDNRYFSGIRVLRELTRINPDKNNSMPIVFTSGLSNMPISKEESNVFKTIGKVTYSITQTPQVWLDYEVYEENENLIYNWDVIEDLFPKGLIDEMYEVYSSYLHCLTDKVMWECDWDKTLQKLIPNYRIKKENDTKERDSGERLLHLKFVEQCKKNPDKIALIAQDRKLTYKETYQIAYSLSEKLINEGVRKGQIIGVILEKGWSQITTVLGILLSGAAYLPIDISNPVERIKYIIEEAEVPIVISTKEKSENLQHIINTKIIIIDDLELVEDFAMNPVARQAEEDLAYVIYTSGSTGKPKGVMINHFGAVNTIEDINRRFHVTSKDCVLALSSLNFDLSVYDIFGLLSEGGSIVIPDPQQIREPSHWEELIRDYHVTIWNSVPALMGLFSEYLESRQETTINSLRLALLSGDWIPVTLPNQLRHLFKNIKIISLGGATEASIWSILYEIDGVDSAWNSIPYGKALTNQSIYVLKDSLEPCPTWVNGNIFIGGKGLALGYLKDHEKTKASFIIHPETGERLYKTGDMGRLLPDGNIEFLGREDLQVKINGYRIEINEIESTLLNHPTIRAAVISNVKKSINNNMLVAYIVVKEGKEVNYDNLKLYLAKYLPDYMIPSVFKILEELPLNENGKVNHKALPEYIEVSESKENIIKEQSDLRQQITKIVNEVLNLNYIDPNENILELGASSVDIIRIANNLERQFRRRPKIKDFYKFPCLASIFKFYESEKIEAKFNTELESIENKAFSSYTMLLDPLEREQFRNEQNNIRYKHIEKEDITLFNCKLDYHQSINYLKRKSNRTFLEGQITMEEFSILFSTFRQYIQENKLKYSYASAGGLYPVQVYLHIKPNCVEGINEGGYFYYNPLFHTLRKVSEYKDMSSCVDDPYVNNKIYESCAFAIFFVAQLAAIAPMYGDRSQHYSIIEAGAMSQVLECIAPICNIGLCQIGEIQFNPLKSLFQLTDDHQHMHTIFGGKIALNEESLNSIKVSEYEEITI